MSEPDFQEPGRRRPRIDPDRVQANREMGKALRAIGAVRTFYVVLAVVCALIGVATILGATNVFPGALPIAVTVAVLLTAVPTVGAWRIGKEPVLWATVVATLWTLFVLVNLFIPPYVTVGQVIWMVLAAGCWAAVMTIQPAMALMRKYPDLRSARKLRGGRKATSREGSSSRGGRPRARR